jgi:hypothetical protein
MDHLPLRLHPVVCQTVCYALCSLPGALRMLQMKLAAVAPQGENGLYPEMFWVLGKGQPCSDKI